MEEAIKQLIMHGSILLLFGLCAGIPYHKAIVKEREEHIVFAWRVAHSALTMGGILLLALAPLISILQFGATITWFIVGCFIVSAYSFIISLYLGPVVGYRGLTNEGPLVAMIVYIGNKIGAISSLLGTIAFVAATVFFE